MPAFAPHPFDQDPRVEEQHCRHVSARLICWRGPADPIHAVPADRQGHDRATGKKKAPRKGL